MVFEVLGFGLGLGTFCFRGSGSRLPGRREVKIEGVFNHVQEQLQAQASFKLRKEAHFDVCSDPSVQCTVFSSLRTKDFGGSVPCILNF